MSVLCLCQHSLSPLLRLPYLPRAMPPANVLQLTVTGEGGINFQEPFLIAIAHGGSLTCMDCVIQVEVRTATQCMSTGCLQLA